MADIAQSQTNLAILLWRMGDEEAARPLYEQALAQRIESLGPDHPDVATVQQGLGFALSRSGEYERAEELLSAALATREATLRIFSASATEVPPNFCTIRVMSPFPNGVPTGINSWGES